MSEISVIIPTYNRAELLQRAVESALRQTVKPLEVIVVDDGSTDGTADLCAAFPDEVRCIRVPNGGVSRARNVGIAAARGDIIGLLDSDDAWRPTKLEVQLAALAARPDAGWSITGCELVDSAGRARPGPQNFVGAFPAFREFDLEPEPFFGRSLTRCGVRIGGESHPCFAGNLFPLLLLGNMGLPSSLLAFRRVFDTVGAFEPSLRVAEDTEFFLRLSSAFPGVLVVRQLVQYRQAQPGSLTASANAVVLSETALRCLDAVVARRGKLSPSEKMRWWEGRRSLMARLAYAQLSELDRRAARRTLTRLFRECPPGHPAPALLWMLTFVPTAVLRALHGAKRRARALAGGLGGT